MKSRQQVKFTFSTLLFCLCLASWVVLARLISSCCEHYQCCFRLVMQLFCATLQRNDHPVSFHTLTHKIQKSNHFCIKPTSFIEYFISFIKYLQSSTEIGEDKGELTSGALVGLRLDISCVQLISTDGSICCG